MSDKTIHPVQPPTRAEFSTGILNKRDQDPEGFLPAATGCETRFGQEDPKDKAQSKQWLQEVEVVQLGQKTHWSTGEFWGDASGILPIDFP